jgi:gliding motility-associated-like protein
MKKYHLNFTQFFKKQKIHKEYMESIIQYHKRIKLILLLLTPLFLLNLEAMAQCNPGIDISGTLVKEDSVCLGALVDFRSNSPGYTGNSVLWDFGDGTTSSELNPNKNYFTPGWKTIKFVSSGNAGSCDEELKVYVTPAPKDSIVHLNDNVQCFVGNNFCIRDYSSAAPGSTVDSVIHVWATGERYVTRPPFPDDYCHSHIDEGGGTVDLVVEVYDRNGCTVKKTYRDFIRIAPKIGPEFTSNRPVECDTVCAVIQNLSKIDLDDVAFFVWDFKDTDRPPGNEPGPIIEGSPDTNQAWWNGVDNDGIINYCWYTGGAFNATLTVVDSFGCTETFTFNATATNFVLNIDILAPDTICTADNPVEFTLAEPLPAGSRFLWNFGDPDSGPDNFDNQNINTEHSYGPGPWMASLNVVAGPCDVTFFDTVVVVGPGSVIEVMGDRVDERQTYQCVITDTVKFPNNSSFFFNDPFGYDEARVDTHYSAQVILFFDVNTGFDSLQISYFTGGKRDSFKRVAKDEEIFHNGFVFEYNETLDSIERKTTGGTVLDRHPARHPGYGFDFKEVFMFLYPGDQTALPYTGVEERGYNPHVWRVWDFGDNYAPQCTTDSRPWRNKNVGINCNFSIDSVPQHWYTPWEELYKRYNEGQFYTQPYLKIQKDPRDTSCYFVNVYPSDFSDLQGDTIIVAPRGLDTSYMGVPIFGDETYGQNVLVQGNCNWKIVQVPDTIWGSYVEYIPSEDAPDVDTQFSAKVTIYKDPNTGEDSLQIAFYDNGVLTSVNRVALTDTIAHRGFEFVYDSGLDSIVRWENGNFIDRHPTTSPGYRFDERRVFSNAVDFDFVADTFYVVLGHDTTWYTRLGFHYLNHPIPGGGSYTFEHETKIKVEDGSVVYTVQLESPLAVNPVDERDTLVGPGIFTIDPHVEVYVDARNFFTTLFTVTENEPPNVNPMASNFINEVAIGGQIVYFEDSKVFIDEEAHRDNFYSETVQCYTVELFHQDTVIHLLCESTASKQLALGPPNARGLTIEPYNKNQCVFDGDPEKMVQFSLRNTKPGCTQRWFAMNFDSLTGPDSWIPFMGQPTAPDFPDLSGSLLTPPKMAPQPFMPYMMAGNFGTQVVRPFPAGVVGNDPNLRAPNGSFTTGLIIGNGANFNEQMRAVDECGKVLKSQVDQTQDSMVLIEDIAECLDTHWSNDFFRILYMNSRFLTIHPATPETPFCAGDTAIFYLEVDRQDSTQLLRWNYGYQGAGSAGSNYFATYDEFFRRYQPYTGPVPGRNDEDIVYNGEDWLYNYVVRTETDDVRGFNIIDTIVTAIFFEYEIAIDKSNPIIREALERAFERLGLNFDEVPEEDLQFYIHDGTKNCGVDTTGISAAWTYGVSVPSHVTDPDNYELDGENRYRVIRRYFNDTAYTGRRVEANRPPAGTSINLPGGAFVRPGSFDVPNYTEGVDYEFDPPRTINWLDSNTNRVIEIFYETGDSFINNEIIDREVVAKVLHFRDSSLRGYDSTWISYTGVNGQDSSYWLHGVWKIPYWHWEKVILDPCNEDSFEYRQVPSNGPMRPSLLTVNTAGCDNRFGTNLLVGFLNEFWLRDNKINYCIGQPVRIMDSLRYWNPDNNDPSWPIIPTPFWRDNYFVPDMEIFEVDWDERDGYQWERGLNLNNQYTKPGKYTITVKSTDKDKCVDTLRLDVFITEITADIGIDSLFSGCNTIIGFGDSSTVADPCLEESCGSNNCDRIVSWTWDFGDSTRNGVIQNPFHNYTTAGEYTVKLRIESELGCVHDTFRVFNIPGPIPDFMFERPIWNDGDSAVICVGDTIGLINMSTGDKIRPSYTMYWGDSSESNPQDSGALMKHAYSEPGTYFLRLQVSDSIPGLTAQNCNRFFPDDNPDLLFKREIKVIVRPYDSVDIALSDTMVCVGQQFEVTALPDSSNARIFTRYTWDFGNGDTLSRPGDDESVTYAYNESGIYTIQLRPDYDRIGFEPKCIHPASRLIEVVDVKADFDIDSSDMPRFCFFNTSTENAITFDWSIEDINEDTEEPFWFNTAEENPCYNWMDRRGEFEICLAVTTAEPMLCQDTVCKTITNTFRASIIPYNVFTPDGDEFNNEFIIDGDGIEEFEIIIYNRWGERVYQSNNVDEGWNGRVNNTGVECPAGTYYYIVSYRFDGFETNKNPDGSGGRPIEGVVTLIR